ncbi:MAG: CHASE3 domain-containing protein [Steroidobacteraceae bacterium]|jgi:signal transduction histidine kinase
MKILGEELGNIGRWYIVLPPLLLIGFLITLIFLAAASQSRLNAADERVHNSEDREQALDEFLALTTDAESEQRGYLLTGEDTYLRSYAAAAGKIGPALDRLRQAYGTGTEPIDEIRRLRGLSHDKLVELDETLALYKRAGLDAALSTARTDMGKRMTDNILASVAVLRQKESAELSAATARWQSDLQLSRWITLGGAILNIGLVVLATVLVYGDMRRRAQQATDLRLQKRELARQVDDRTRELTALSTHLQGVSELEKSALSRELHDELGGLLVAARMDLSWLQQRLPTSDPAIEQRFKRIHESLSAGIDLKRRVVEELRPTLLDNMGLFAALRWQFKESCRRTGLKCSETIPETELRVSPDAAIGVFRVAQEALTNILKHAEATSADLAVSIQGDSFVLRISDDGKGISMNRPQTITSHGLASMRHRIAALGGTWDIHAPATGGTVVTARIPLSSMLLFEPSPPPPVPAT